jgi:hypothetical protein
VNQNESLKVFVRFVKQKHDKVIQDLNSLINAMVTDTKQHKLDSNEKLIVSSVDLNETLSPADVPLWLNELSTKCHWYKYTHSHTSNPPVARQFIDHLVGLKPSIEAHKWFTNQSTVHTSFDFDEIYERYRIESKLPELFSILIDLLEQMIDSGEIDSIKVATSLKQLISLLKQNKSGSYFSTMASWEFLKSFIKNTSWSVIDSIPVLKQLKKGFEDTLVEFDMELEQVHKQVATEMKETYNTTVETLVYKSQSSNLLENKSN